MMRSLKATHSVRTHHYHLLHIFCENEIGLLEAGVTYLYAGNGFSCFGLRSIHLLLSMYTHYYIYRLLQQTSVFYYATGFIVVGSSVLVLPVTMSVVEHGSVRQMPQPVG